MPETLASRPALSGTANRHHCQIAGMNTLEARALVATELEKYRRKSYGELAQLVGETKSREVVGPSGVKYQLEIQALWDDKPTGVLRIMASLDDGGASAYVPLCDDFLVAPDGTFVGE